jgi:vacuolar-type H+-ATPase subunit I/STV1
VTRIASTPARATERQGARIAGRIGLAARGFVYLLIGWLAVQIARGHRTHEANQRGALADVAGHSFGLALLWILGFGFAAYALWRFSEAAWGTAADGKKASARLKSLVRGLVYAGFCISTFLFIAGTSRNDQAKQQATLTARVMRHSFGQWLVGIAGVVVLIIGLGMIANGLRHKFEKNLKMHELQGVTRTVVVGAGTIGVTARGIVFAIVGGLVIDAAITFDPKKSQGLDGALRTLAGQPYGPWLLGLVAAGLIVFGLYGFALSRWGRT